MIKHLSIWVLINIQVYRLQLKLSGGGINNITVLTCNVTSFNLVINSPIFGQKICFSEACPCKDGVKKIISSVPRNKKYYTTKVQLTWSLDLLRWHIYVRHFTYLRVSRTSVLGRRLCLKMIPIDPSGCCGYWLHLACNILVVLTL